MKRVGYLYDKLLDKNLLALAFKEASKGKKNKRYVKRFLDKQDYYVDKLYEWLKTDTLKLSNNKHITIFEASANKTRDIVVPKFFPDQVVHWAYCIVMRPIFMKGMYQWSCGSIKGRGVHYGINKIQRELAKPKAKYILKTDFRKYFQSVKKGKLLELLERKIKDKRMINLTKQILENGGDGLPIGYYTSQWFSNFYLENIDHYIKEELGVKFYMRYVDDLVFIDSNKKRLHNARVKLDQKLKADGYGLDIKPNWQVWKKDSRPLDFLGFRIVRSQKRLRKRSWIMLNRIPRRTKQAGYCTLKRAYAYVSRIGWLVKCSNGVRYYKEKLKQTLSKGECCKIISQFNRKEKLA